MMQEATDRLVPPSFLGSANDMLLEVSEKEANVKMGEHKTPSVVGSQLADCASSPLLARSYKIATTTSHQKWLVLQK